MRELENTQSDSDRSAGGKSPERRPFQFGLRAMFVGVGLLSVLFAIMGVVGPMGSTFIIWFLLLVAGHVSGNVSGTRKNGRRNENHAHEVGPMRPASEPSIADASAACARLPGLDRGTRLRESTRLGWPMIVTTAVGTMLGGALGATLLLLSLGGKDYTGVVLGSLSSAVVGGFLGFLASSFLAVALNAWQEAARGDIG